MGGAWRGSVPNGDVACKETGPSTFDESAIPFECAAICDILMRKILVLRVLARLSNSSEWPIINKAYFHKRTSVSLFDLRYEKMP